MTERPLHEGLTRVRIVLRKLRVRR